MVVESFCGTTGLSVGFKDLLLLVRDVLVLLWNTEDANGDWNMTKAMKCRIERMEWSFRI